MLKNVKNDTIHRGCTVIEENGEKCTGKHAANVLAEDFATDSKITIPMERSRNNTNAQEKQTQKKQKKQLHTNKSPKLLRKNDRKNDGKNY